MVYVCIIMGQIGFCLLIVLLMVFKAKDSEIKAALLWLGNVSKDFSNDNMKNTEVYGYVFDFQLIIIVLMLIVFWISINIWWKNVI